MDNVTRANAQHKNTRDGGKTVVNGWIGRKEIEGWVGASEKGLKKEKWRCLSFDVLFVRGSWLIQKGRRGNTFQPNTRGGGWWVGRGNYLLFWITLRDQDVRGKVPEFFRVEVSRKINRLARAFDLRLTTLDFFSSLPTDFYTPWYAFTAREDRNRRGKAPTLTCFSLHICLTIIQLIQLPNRIFRGQSGGGIESLPPGWSNCSLNSATHTSPDLTCSQVKHQSNSTTS